MQTVCAKNICTGCMVCSDICQRKAISIRNDLDSSYAVIDEKACVRCGRCHQVCPNNTVVQMTSQQQWHQGWAKDNATRLNGSSGGVASAIANAFIQRGGYVCSCVFSNGTFTFEIVSDVNAIKKHSGSKYVKSNPKGVYIQVLELLKKGKDVLFIGLPCQVAAIKNYVGGFDKGLYTIDLICHGTPSPQVLETYLGQHGYTLKNLNDIRFRDKNSFRLKGMTRTGMQDGYLMAFLGGLSFTNNCYDCRYARLKRVSDVTLGDSWGSDLPKEEKNKGVSLILCQTEKGRKMIDQSELELKKVNIEKAISSNGQLSKPSIKPAKRDCFMQGLTEHRSFDGLVIRYLPYSFIKQCVKMILIRMKIYRGGVYRMTYSELNCIDR